MFGRFVSSVVVGFVFSASLFAAGCQYDEHPSQLESLEPAERQVPDGATRIDLSGRWTFSHDANSINNPAPVLDLGRVTESSVTVGYDGIDGRACGCNAMHKVVELPKSFDCSKTKLAFDYASGGSFGKTSNQAISIRFCRNGACSDKPFYRGDQYKASMQTGVSICGWEWNNSLPSATAGDPGGVLTQSLKPGRNVIDLSTLPETSGGCTGSFDTVDIHLEAYACFAGVDRGTQTLANVDLIPE